MAKRARALKPPSFISPALATLVGKPPEGDTWLHEIKLDGYRIAARIAGGKVALLTRTGLNWTARFRSIADELASLRVRSAYLDGEVVALTAGGVSDFGALQEALSAGSAAALIYFVFDLLHWDGRDMTKFPLLARKADLRRLLGSRSFAHTRYSDHFEGRGKQFFEKACRTGLEGIVSKSAASRYRSGRVGDWLKVKCTQRQEFVVGGWLPSEARGRHLASLLLGYYKGGNLIYAGKVGTGFDLKLGRGLVARLEKRTRSTPPFVEVPGVEARGARWVVPRLVVEVEFTEWTRDGRARHPSFKGVREDKKPAQVHRERPKITAR